MLRVLFLSVLINVAQAEEYRLVFSHVIYRHGDRAPGKTFPNDKYQENAWPMGWSQLTPKGIQRMYDLGAYFRKRYSNFLNRNFTREEIYIRSSDRDRALESGQSCIAGLYQPPIQTKCNAWLDWRPIPIHAVARENDHLLQTDADKNCPAYQRAYKEQSTQYIAELNANHAAFFVFVMNQTGLKKLDFKSAGDVYGTISREKEQGWQLPEWVDRVWNETSGETVFDILARLKKTERVLEYNSLEKTKLMSGVVTGDIVERMKQKANGTLKKPSKMVMYSAHEGTVTGLLFAMDLFNDRVPYAGCLIIELHESTSKPGQYFVTVHYRNDSAVDPFPLLPPGCRSAAIAGLYCPLEAFEKSVQSFILYPVSKREEACGTDKCAARKSGAAIARISLVMFLHFCAVTIWKSVF